ncbi:hypothetical protein Alsa3_CDS0059 [Staphylococcus phage Alsa_3]|nr:hypothetical protein Alsa3_CDS0059 [Staphylococcus phage Alsa_3]
MNMSCSFNKGNDIRVFLSTNSLGIGISVELLGVTLSLLTT